MLVLQAADECSRIRTWVLAPMERLWSQLAPRKQASEIAGVVVDTVRPRRGLVWKTFLRTHLGAITAA